MYTKMGSSSGVARGQLRPHFGGRQPFLVAALLVGLGVLSVSYYNLSTHYTALELEFSNILQRKDSLEKGLLLKDDEFEKSRELTLKKDRDLTELNMQMSEMTNLNNHLKDDLMAKKQEIESLVSGKETVESNLSKLRLEIATLEKTNKDMNTTLSELRKKNEALTKELNDKKTTVSDSNKRDEADTKAQLTNDEVSNLPDKDADSDKTDTAKTATLVTAADQLLQPQPGQKEAANSEDKGPTGLENDTLNPPIVEKAETKPDTSA
ncbi:hypothetical protein HDE_02763 [Halotydeus destructor]|nr:hypothetical protein HDE_02763 [Halotydeus destructor]